MRYKVNIVTARDRLFIHSVATRAELTEIQAQTVAADLNTVFSLYSMAWVAEVVEAE